jgi:hypothetical protein
VGQELEWDDVPSAGAGEPADHFKPVKLSPRAIDAAFFVFSKLSASQTWGRMGKLRYEFGFDAEGPVLERVLLG